MRFFFIIVILLPTTAFPADSYWQRMKNYLAYLIGRSSTPVTTDVTPPAATAPQPSVQPPLTMTTELESPSSVILSPGKPLSKSEALQLLRQQSEKWGPPSEAITATLGTLGRTATKKTAPIIKALEDITIEKIANIIQVKAAHQGANADCGYNAFKNAVALGNALFGNKIGDLKGLEEPIKEHWRTYF